MYIDKHNEKNNRFKVGDRVRISKFKNIFAKGYTPNSSSEKKMIGRVIAECTGVIINKL